MIRRRALLAAPLAVAPALTRAQGLAPLAADTPAAAPLLARLRAGGMVLFFRHADTIGEPCDRFFRIGDRTGQRNISVRGREQSARIGAQVAASGIPVQVPVLAGPVFRARDTAELAFGTDRVVVTDSLLADDYAGARLDWVLAEHRRLFSEPVPTGANRVLVGHRTPAIMISGGAVSDRIFPEGAALVVEPRGAAGFAILGVVMFAPIAGGGFHGCG